MKEIMSAWANDYDRRNTIGKRKGVSRASSFVVNAGHYGTGLGSSERGWPGTVSSASVNTVLV